MLFIGGTRDGQRLNVSWNNGNPIFRIPIEPKPEPYSRQSLLSGSSPVPTELYIKKEIWKKRQYIFSVMVKDGANNLLDTFLDKYNK